MDEDGQKSSGHFTFVVEHLDPELGPWSALEYQAIAVESKNAGCNFMLSSIPESLRSSPDFRAVMDIAVTGDSIETVYADRKSRVCLLDPAAKQELSPSDAELFDVFLFGGILGMLGQKYLDER